MINFIMNFYDWIKAFHLIAVFAWMAGLFYLPRLFVYHCDASLSSETNRLFQLMERRLFRIIMNPAMIIAWIFGVLLIIYQIHAGGFTQGWLHLKLMMTIFLTFFHHLLGIHRKQFEQGANTKTHKYFRIINEIPTLALIIIVICVIVKPF